MKKSSTRRVTAMMKMQIPAITRVMPSVQTPN